MGFAAAARSLTLPVQRGACWAAAGWIELRLPWGTPHRQQGLGTPSAQSQKGDDNGKSKRRETPVTSNKAFPTSGNL